MKKLPQIAKISSLLYLASLMVFSPTVMAQQATSQVGVSMEVSAPVYEFTISPGSNKQEIIKVKNTGTAAITLYPIVVDFKSNNEDGSPVLLKEGEENGTYSLTKWISVSRDPINLAPDNSAALNFNITVPANAEPGGHYGAIMFSSKAPQTTGNAVAIGSEVGSLILVRVAGNANELAGVKEFSTDKQSYTSANVNFSIKIENQGSVHVKPTGTITIKNLLGYTVAVLDVNTQQNSILPGSIRHFVANWASSGFNIGPYTATLNLVYGSSSKNLTASTSFWILPWTTILVGLLVLIIALLVLFFAVKRYNKWVISKAQKQDNPQ